MDLLAPVRRLDRLQQRHRRLSIPFAVVKKFGDDQGGNLGALIAYYGFFSLFPLLLAFVTILGFVLRGDTTAQHSVTHAVAANFPGLGKTIDVGHLHGNAVALVIGVLGALWAGLAVTNAAEQAFDRIWAIPFKARANFAQKRLRGLATVALLGVLNVVATLASGLVAGGLGGPLLVLAGVVVSLAVNGVLFFAAYRILTNSEVPTSAMWPGTVIAAILWTVLQAVGGAYIGHVQAKASATYSTFGTVIALLTWLFLGARVLIYSAELNVVLHRGLFPRSLLDPPSTPGDEQTWAALAKVEERHPSEEIEVSFDGHPVDGHRPDPDDAPAALTGAAGGSEEGRGGFPAGHRERP